MKIGIYDPYLDDLGGGEKYMMTIAEHLSQNHDVDIFWNNPGDLSSLGVRFSIDFSRIRLVKNIFDAKVSMLKRLTETQKYNVIIFLSDGSIPLVLSEKLLIHIQQPLKKMQTDSLINKIKLSRVNMFFTNSKFTKSFIDKKFSVKTVVLYPPVEILAKKIKKENIILHVGRFRVKNVANGDYKKQSVMVNAFKDLIDKGLKGWKFVLAVSVQEKDKEAFELIKKSASGFPIEFLVNKPNQELWQIYSKAKIYWHASGFGEDLDANPEFAEHFGISTVEAMGAGAVPVVINAGGQTEIVEDGKNGFLWNSLEELKEKTLNLTENKILLEKVSKNAIDSSKKFSKNKFYEEIDKLIL